MTGRKTQKVVAGELEENFHRLIEGLLFQQLGRGVLRNKYITFKKKKIKKDKMLIHTGLFGKCCKLFLTLHHHRSLDLT